MSNTQIANYALGHLGSTKQISNLTTERSKEADALRTFYEVTRDEVLRSFNWPFARKYIELALVTSPASIEWAYAYRQPSDCIAERSVRPKLQTENEFNTLGYGYPPAVRHGIIYDSERIPFVLGSDESGGLIFTNQDLAELEYTYRITNDMLMPADFQMAFSYLLASRAAPSITGGDPTGLQSKNLQLYFNKISEAEANSTQAEQMPPNPPSAYVRARNC